jgi:hypothetical protein
MFKPLITYNNAFMHTCRSNVRNRECCFTARFHFSGGECCEPPPYFISYTLCILICFVLTLLFVTWMYFYISEDLNPTRANERKLRSSYYWERMFLKEVFKPQTDASHISCLTVQWNKTGCIMHPAYAQHASYTSEFTQEVDIGISKALATGWMGTA